MKIKQLEFTQVSGSLWRAETPLWDYKVRLHTDGFYYIPDVEPGVPYETLGGAQKACQDAFEMTITECMEDQS